MPGFLARGVCPEDGKSTYPNTSRDQYTHAVHGMWLYFHSPLADADTKREIGVVMAGIADRMTRTVIPENDYDSLRSDGSRDTRGISRMWHVKGHEAARLPMIYAAAWDTTGRQEYLDRCHVYLDPAIEQSRVVENNQPTYAWLQMQASLELLDALDDNPQRQARMRAIMTEIAERCAVRARNAEATAAKVDLAALCTDWRTGEGLKWEGTYRRSWYCIRESGEAAMTQLMAPGLPYPEEQQELLVRAITRLDYQHVSSNGIFYLQAAYWKARRQGLLTD